MSDKSMPDKIVRLQREIATACLKAKVSHEQAAAACLLVATSITRTNPRRTHAELITLLTSMDNMPPADATVDMLDVMADADAAGAPS